MIKILPLFTLNYSLENLPLKNRFLSNLASIFGFQRIFLWLRSNKCVSLIFVLIFLHPLNYDLMIVGAACIHLKSKINPAVHVLYEHSQSSPWVNFPRILGFLVVISTKCIEEIRPLISCEQGMCRVQPTSQMILVKYCQCSCLCSYFL